MGRPFMAGRDNLPTTIRLNSARNRHSGRFLSVIASLAWVLAILTLSNSIAAAKISANDGNPYVRSFPLPNAGAPRNVIAGGGDLWFTAAGENAIGRLQYTSPVDYDYTFFSIPTTNSQPYDLAWDGSNVWFTQNAANKIGKLNPNSGVITEYVIPTANSQPTGISVHGTGLIWFTQRAGNKLASFDPLSENFVEYAYTSAGALPEDVSTRGSSEFIWFSAPGLNRLVGFNRNTGEFKSVPTTQPGLGTFTPLQVDVDNGGNPWISTAEGFLGRHAVATFQFFRWYHVAPADARIDGLFFQPLSNGLRVWYTESNSGHAGQLTTTPSGALRSNWRFPIAQSTSDLRGIAPATDGSVWIAARGDDAMLQWEPPFAFSLHLPIISNAN